jgi:tRNA-Thr(GGU) m(6)t(6)A37 methyltransferase TsaA
MQPILVLIGVVHSHLKRLEDCPLQESEKAPEATIEIFPEYIKGIKNIKKGDQLLLLTWLHKSDRTVVATHPRNDPSIPLTGVFSTRSPDRPNPIGLHIVNVVSISTEGMIKVSGLEVLDQTPLLDIKPILRSNVGI